MNNHEHKHVNELSIPSYGLGVNVVKLLINSYDESLHTTTHIVSIPGPILVFLNRIITRDIYNDNIHC